MRGARDEVTKATDSGDYKWRREKRERETEEEEEGCFVHLREDNLSYSTVLFSPR
jgi:hypothetical protein